MHLDHEKLEYKNYKFAEEMTMEGVSILVFENQTLENGYPERLSFHKEGFTKKDFQKEIDKHVEGWYCSPTVTF